MNLTNILLCCLLIFTCHGITLQQQEEYDYDYEAQETASNNGPPRSIYNNPDLYEYATRPIKQQAETKLQNVARQTRPLQQQNNYVAQELAPIQHPLPQTVVHHPTPTAIQYSIQQRQPQQPPVIQYPEPQPQPQQQQPVVLQYPEQHQQLQPVPAQYPAVQQPSHLMQLQSQHSHQHSNIQALPQLQPLVQPRPNLQTQPQAHLQIQHQPHIQVQQHPQAQVHQQVQLNRQVQPQPQAQPVSSSFVTHGGPLRNLVRRIQSRYEPVTFAPKRQEYDLEQVTETTPSKYEFEYAVQDPLTGDAKTQKESREGDAVIGSYSVVDADGTKRTVEYRADAKSGFNAIIHTEPSQMPNNYKKHNQQPQQYYSNAPRPTVTRYDSRISPPRGLSRARTNTPNYETNQQQYVNYADPQQYQDASQQYQTSQHQESREYQETQQQNTIYY